MNSITKKIVVAVSVAMLGTIGVAAPADAGPKQQREIWCC